jgi:3-deoxy-D-manno-octulosonic-acid transferase
MTLLDLLYIPLAIVTAPMWAFKKRRAGWGERFGKGQRLPEKSRGRPRVLLHAVSVGEVSALRSLVPLLTPSTEVVVSATTDTGLARARELFGDSCVVVRYPLDFSWSVARFLDRVSPDVVALVELEVWPQFVRGCVARKIPICVINGRLSARSARGYARIRGFFGRVLRGLEFAAVQDATYAGRFEALGMRPDRVLITGSMKWDNAVVEDAVPGSEELARELGIDRTRPLVVAGSTAEGEEALVRDAVGEHVQVLCAPRKLERADDAAAALPGCIRRSKQLDPSSAAAGVTGSRYYLLDTIGELRKAYALADVVVVGRSFGSLYGSDPTEPVGLGKATLIGPSHADFVQMVEVLSRAGGMKVVRAQDLRSEIEALLQDASAREAMGSRGRAAIALQRGASERHAALIRSLWEPTASVAR